MGIVVYCPNGHRVKVKDEFAGKRVHCPTCQAKTRVPRATPTAPPAPPGAMPVPASCLPTAQMLTLPPAAIAALPRARPLDDAGGSSVFLPTSMPLPVPALHPALAEWPELSWRIAHPGGQPSEPMSAGSMQAWLDARQADGSEFVWRSDWPAWIPAREIFPDQFS